MFADTPNPRAAENVKTDDELLLAELAYSPAFRRFVQLIVAPRIIEVREKLIRNIELPDGDRRGFVMFLAETERVLEAVYVNSETEELPATIRALFH